MSEPATTPSQTVGPFLSIVLPWPDGPELVAAGAPGAVLVRGTLTDGAGEAVPDGLIEIWQADPDGRFQHADDPRSLGSDGFGGFGRCATDGDGRFWFRTVRPGRVDDEQAPHIDVTVFARGLLKHLVTRIYLPGEPTNDDDPVLQSLEPADRQLLVARADGDDLHFDIVLQGERETPFFAV